MKYANCTVAFAAGLFAALAYARELEAVPGAMIGTWGWDGESCRREDDGRVTVSATSVAFFAASYDVQSIVDEGDGTIRVTGIVHEEGEPETARGTVRLKLVADGRLWVLTDTGLDHVYSFCPQRP